MFDDIERKYQKDLRAKRFTAYYWPRVVVITIVAIVLDLLLGVHRWLVYGCAVAIFIIVVAMFFLKEYRYAHKTNEAIRESKGLSGKIAAYHKIDNSRRIDKLILDLAQHNLRTKSDIKLTLGYFESRLPVNAKMRLLDWVFTTIIALSSIIILTYDDSINTINLHRLFAIFAPSVVVALIILTPFLIARLIYIGITRSHNKTDTSLVQDLAYIYVNFEKYQKQLETKKL